MASLVEVQAGIVAPTSRRRDGSRRALVAPAIAGATLCVVSAAIVLGTPGPGARGWIAAARVVLVAAPVGAGLWAWRRPDARGFGRVLVAAGLLWGLGTLAESSDPVVYSIGRVVAWVAGPSIIYLMLSFPSGRLAGRPERTLVGLAVALIGLLFVPTALIVEQ
jgi:hypothetical protein